MLVAGFCKAQGMLLVLVELLMHTFQVDVSHWIIVNVRLYTRAPKWPGRTQIYFLAIKEQFTYRSKLLALKKESFIINFFYLQTNIRLILQQLTFLPPHQNRKFKCCRNPLKSRTSVDALIIDELFWLNIISPPYFSLALSSLAKYQINQQAVLVQYNYDLSKLSFFKRAH